MKKLVLSIALLTVLLTSANVNVFADYIYNSAFLGYFSINMERASRKGLPTMMKLAKLCFDGGLVKHSRNCYNTIIYKKPKNKAANTYLGKVKCGKDYVFPHERDKMLQEQNKGKKIWGEVYVSETLFKESQKALREEMKLSFDPMFFKTEFFELYIDCSGAEAWDKKRLIESIYSAWKLEFSSGIGKTKEVVKIIAFRDSVALKKHFSDATGQVAKEEYSYNETDKTLLTSYYNSDTLIRSVVFGILSQLGTDLEKCDYWAVKALQEYFVACQETSDRITIGYVKAKLTTSANLDNNFSLFSRLLKMKKSEFETNNDENTAISWQLFYVANHEYQGVFKPQFHSKVKQALKGKGSYESMKKITKWNLVIGQLQNLVNLIPIGA